MKLLSVIVPVYNTDISVLKRCFDSIRELSAIDYEVIVVDDGSKEEIRLFCEYYIQQHSTYFQYEWKSNSGVSSARNFGIEKACGKYIMFVDSDDVLRGREILPGDFEVDSDLIFYNITYIKSEYEKVQKELENGMGVVESRTIIEKIITTNRFHGPWAKLFKREFLNSHQIRFDEKMIQAEDAVFNIGILIHNPTIFYWDKSVYRYYLSNATSRGRWKKNPELMLQSYYSLYQAKLKSIEGFSEKSRKRLISQLLSNTEYHLFQSCMELVMIECFSDTMKNSVFQFSAELSNGAVYCTVKARLVAKVIGKRLWFLIKMLALLRDFYIAWIKKTWS